MAASSMLNFCMASSSTSSSTGTASAAPSSSSDSTTRGCSACAPSATVAARMRNAFTITSAPVTTVDKKG